MTQYEDYFARKGITQIRDTGNRTISCLVHGKPVELVYCTSLFRLLDDLTHDNPDQPVTGTP